MSDTPERIWVAPWREGDWSEGDWDDNEGKTLNDKPCIEYVRTDRIEALTKERDELHDRITAMETGDWSEVRLVRFENGQFDLTAGPIPAIAEYLAQMMEDGKGEYFNFMEVQINHKSAGPMVLSLQRKHGNTPNELRKAAEAKLAKAVEALEESVREFDCPIARAAIAELKGETP